MIRIGIVGAENSHSAAISKTLNVQKKVRGFKVEYIWGETAKFAKNTAEVGQIPNIVKRPIDMLGKVDALIVDHRHGKFHLAPAVPFVEKRIPCFIDKPLCYRASEGRKFLALARKKKTPITSFSVIPHQKAFMDFTKEVGKLGKLVSAATYGPSDLKSKYGGVFFYGIHQVEAALQAFGYDVAKVVVTKNGSDAAAQMLYPSGAIVTVNLIKEGAGGFRFTALGEKGSLHYVHKSDDNAYLHGIQTFCRMFKTRKEPKGYTHEAMLQPVKVLEAMEKSIKSGKTVRVAK